MKKKEWNEGLNHLDPDLIEKHIEQKERLRQKKQKSERDMVPLWGNRGLFLADSQRGHRCAYAARR